jgi:redox-sensitive bicupin YhaK (pirin superfamily)
MKTTLHKANTRGIANLGWLNSRHTFSFSHYYDPERVHFGALRVLNDDRVAAGMGFGTHPHDNMEIVSIPLAGDLEHRDSIGNSTIIKHGDVQIMSAGTGVKHSEYNHSKTEEVKFLQIWVLPKERNITPRYDQKTFDVVGRQNQWQTIVAPDDAAAVWINQEAWFTLGNLSAGQALPYTFHQPSHGLYLFVLSGDVTVAGQALSTRDGLGITDTTTFEVIASSDAELLLMEVPMLELR